MANKVISMQQIRALIQLLEQRFSLRRIAIQLDISRQTVTFYKCRLQSSSLSLRELRQLPDADLAQVLYAPVALPDFSGDARRMDFNSRVTYLLAELKRTGVTRLLLWREYSATCADHYKYTRFCILLKEAARPTEATMHLVHAPAAMVMVDFAGDKMQYIDLDTGEVTEVPVLVGVLPFSNYTFAIAVENAKIPLTVKALNGCIEYFGGATLSLKTDNMTQVVTKSCKYEPLFTQVLQQWALHNNITLLVARVRKPRDKAAVENIVKIAYRRIYAPLRDEVFTSLQQLNAAIRKQLILHNDTLMQLKDHSRKARFELKEKHLLQPLPAEPFVIKHQVLAKVQKNYHITLGENYHHYSVPYQYIGKQVSVVYDTDHVEIYLLHQRIALHTRSYKKHDFTTVKTHMPAGHQQYFEQQGYTGAYFLEQANRIGNATHAYIEAVLQSRAFTEQTYNACMGILRLDRKYGATRVETACARALQGQVYNYKTIQNILINNLDQLEPQQQTALFRVPAHTNLRGPEAFQ
jgi:transposase